MNSDFEAVFQTLRSRFTTYLAAQVESDAPAGLNEACDYLLSSGGKHIRPIMLYLAGLAISPKVDPASLHAPAAAVELIHVYSLVHDDLPAMDDDDLRRGKPTVHRAFDEATAILVGDGLQARAFRLLADAPDLGADQKIAMLRTLAHAAGPAGMVGGQFIDIRATDTDMSLEELREMHLRKTGALIRASLALGGIAAGGTGEQLAALDDYGKHIGLGFQVVDDILDVEGDTAQLGKTSGKDGNANKPTYVKLLGVDGAREEAKRLLHAALESLKPLGATAAPLGDMAAYIIKRDR